MSRLSQLVLFAGLLATLAACAGTTVSSIDAETQTNSQRLGGARLKSWMTPAAKQSPLIYVSDTSAGVVFVLSYPKGNVVGELTGFKAPAGECVDSHGDIWITDFELSEAFEFAHGGSAPIASLSWAGAEVVGCAVDPGTGDLALTNLNPAQVAVYQNAEGTPTIYSSADYGGFLYCSYDNNGNLFLSSRDPVEQPLAELAAGSAQLDQITVNQPINPTSIQWDGSYLSVTNLADSGKKRPTIVDRVAISGSSGTVVSSIKLANPYHRSNPLEVQLWVYGDRILGPTLLPHRGERLLNIWAYPAGGKPLKTLQPSGAEELWGTAVSKSG